MVWITEKLGLHSGQGQEIFLFNSVQTGSEAHLASYPMGTAAPFHGGDKAKV
jgi:hypothetical protein